MRRESSTVIVVVGEVQETLLDEVARFPNISVARPPQGEADGFEAAARALRQASRGIAPYILVPADPLAAVATQWQAMWDLPHGPWWPPLDDLIDTARHFFAGALSEGPGTLTS